MTLRGFAKQQARKQSGYVSARPLYALGGLNEDENPRAIPPTDLIRAENTARKGSLTGTRPGVAYGDGDWDAAVTGDAPIQGVHEFSWASGANRKVVAVSGGNVYDGHDQTAEDKVTNSVTITAGADNQWTFADYQDKMFAAGGASGDSCWYWDGTSALNKIDFSALDSEPQYIFEKWNFMFVGGLTGTAYDDNPMVGRYCDYGKDATDIANWPSTNVMPGQLLNENFGVGSFGGEYNTGFGEFLGKDSDFLLFLTNKRIFAYQKNDPGLITGSETAFKHTNTIGVGCVSQKAFVNMGADAGDAVFLSRDGVHSLAQSREHGEDATTYLSWPIRRTWQTLNQSRLDKAWGAYWPSEGMVIFSVSTGSNTTNDLLLVMDTKGAQSLTPETVRWYKWRLNGVTPNVLRLARGSDGKPYVYVGGTAGEVCRFDRDTYRDLTDAGTISVDMQTPNDDFGLPSRDKNIGDAFILVKGSGSGTVQHTLMLDDGRVSGQTSLLEVPASAAQWAPAGSARWGISQWSGDNAVKRHRVPGVGSSTTVGHRFQRSGSSQPFFIGLLDQQVMITGPTADAEANTVGN